MKRSVVGVTRKIRNVRAKDAARPDIKIADTYVGCTFTLDWAATTRARRKL